jgi:hypothetical protein
MVEKLANFSQTLSPESPLEEKTLFESKEKIDSFEVHNRKMHLILNNLRVKRQKERNDQKIARINRLKEIDAKGYSFSQLIKPNRI